MAVSPASGDRTVGPTERNYAAMTAAVAFPQRTCPHCGALVTTPFCTACGCDAAGLDLPLVRPSAEALAAMRRLNVGAALLPGFWTFAHGAPVLGTLFWLAFFPLPPISLGIMVYLLFTGNRVALQRRRFADPAEFARVQRAWLVAGLASFPVMLFALVTCLYVLAVLVAMIGGQ